MSLFQIDQPCLIVVFFHIKCAIEYHQTINSDCVHLHDWGFGTMDLCLYLKLDEWIATLKSDIPF